MSPVLVVPGEPTGQIDGSPLGGPEWDGIGPFAQQGLNEALGLAVGLWRVGPGADVPDREHPQDLAEQAGNVAGAVVDHHPLHPYAAVPEPAQGTDEESRG